MNDNFIKMFIGGEEVVSNKEFTINEEMLSASSTILNNCYPASWEESKDYVSNFYYPKDYSKFILGKGNFTYGTEQYSILSVSGETFMQFTTNVEKELSNFEVYGKTTQETTTGKNLLQTTSKTITINNNYYRDTPTDILIDETMVGKYLSFSFDINITSLTTTSSDLRATLGYGTISSIMSANIKQVVYSNVAVGKYSIKIENYEITNDMVGKYIVLRYLGFRTQSSATYTYSNAQLEFNKTATDFEPYTGGMPSPNPDYPSELVSVGYENLFNKNGTINGQQTTTILDTGVRITQPTSGTYKYNYISLGGSELLGKTITISSNIVSSASNKGQLSLYYANSSNPAISLVGNLATTGSATFTIANSFPSNASRVNLLIYSNTNGVGNANDYTDFTNLIITKGTQAHSYIPYGKYGIEIKNVNKNLFTGLIKGIGLSSLTGAETINANAGTSDFIEVDFNTNQNYYLSGLTNTIRSYVAAYNSNKQFLGRTGATRKTQWGLTSTSFTSGTPQGTGDIAYLRVTQYASSDDTGTIDDIDNLTIQLETGNTNTTYIEHKENSQSYILDAPLRAIGDYKDRLFIQNGVLYVERKIGSVILNGSETEWGGSMFYNYYRARINFTNMKQPASNNEYGVFSNYFNQNDGVFSSRTVLPGMLGAFRNSQTIYIETNQTSLADFKTWLSTHNTEVQYPLEEPYVEEIGQVLLPSAYNGINNIFFYTGLETTEDVYYYWKNYDILFAGIVKNSGDISLRPTNPKYCSLQILDYKTFLSESDTLDFVISDKTIAEAITIVVDAISGYGFVLGTINISQADDIIGAYSTLNKTAYDVFQYLANISGSRWRARFVDSDTMAIDFYDPELLPRANDIDYTQQYWEDNKIVDLTFNYGTRDYRNKQIILSDEVYGGIDYTEVLLSNGYGTSYITQNNIANITSITVNGVEAEVITQSEKDLGVDADFYYTPGKNVVESTISYTAGTQIIITYTPLVKGRQIVYNDEEVTRIATQTNTTGVISRYENRNDILSSDELENIAESYIKYKGKPEIILKLTTLNNDLFNIGEICYFNSPIADLAQDYMVKSKATNYTSVAGETNIFYTYELTSSFNSEKAINYFDNQRNKATGNIAEGESITRNIDINNSAMIIWENTTITEISVSVDGDNALNSVLNSPFIQ